MVNLYKFIKSLKLNYSYDSDDLFGVVMNQLNTKLNPAEEFFKIISPIKVNYGLESINRSYKYFDKLNKNSYEYVTKHTPSV